MATKDPYDRRNWLRQLFQIEGSVLLQILPKVAVFAAVSWVLTWLENRSHIPRLPMAPFTVLGTALGLLLTLRTNASYDRFWEGRKNWGMIVNRSRNLARQIAGSRAEAGERSRVAKYLCAFVHASKRKLWRETDFPEVERLLGKSEADLFARAPGAPQQCLLALGRCLSNLRADGRIDSQDQRRLEEDVTSLIDQLGACERIQNTPLPLGYVLHLRTFLTVYCLSLTLALVDPLGWYSPLVIAFVSFAFLGIERAGIEIEDPFEKGPNDIDLEKITQTIERDVAATLA
jgi:putative membrane protein